jgi:hypothetical protein
MTIDDPDLITALQTVFKRSQTDLAFRELCLSDPAKALEVATGIRLEGQTIRFVEDAARPDPAPES